MPDVSISRGNLWKRLAIKGNDIANVKLAFPCDSILGCAAVGKLQLSMDTSLSVGSIVALCNHSKQQDLVCISSFIVNIDPFENSEVWACRFWNYGERVFPVAYF